MIILKDRQKLALENAWLEGQILTEETGQIWWEPITETGPVSIGLTVNK